MKISALAGVLAIVLAGCASTAPDPGDRDGLPPTTAASTEAPTTVIPTNDATGTESEMPATPSRFDPSGLFTTPAPRPPARPMTLTGTPRAGVEAGCLLLDGYLLIGGPREVLTGGRPVTVTGRPDPTLRSICQQGIPFQVESAEAGERSGG